MEINAIDKNSFEGKIKFSKKMSKPLKTYVDKVLNYPVNGITAREKIAKRSYDMNIYNLSSKKAIHPQIGFITSFKVAGDSKYYSVKIKNNYSTVYAANEIAKYIEWLDKTKERFYGYNNFFEHIASLWRNIFSKN